MKNLVEHLTAVVHLLPNEAPLLRLVSAVLLEMSEEWESGRKCLTMDAE